MKNIEDFINESAVDFNVIKPNINYSDEYKIEIINNKSKVGYLVFIDLSDDLYEDYIDPEDDSDVLDFINENFDEVRWVSELHIDSKYRNNSFGSKLFKYFIDNFSDKPILLYASNYDGGTNDLTKFYLKFGFNEINDSGYFILEK